MHSSPFVNIVIPIYNVERYLVNYQDLITRQINLVELAEHVGINEINSSVLEKRIASPDDTKRRLNKNWSTPVERILLNFIGGNHLKRLGYK